MTAAAVAERATRVAEARDLAARSTAADDPYEAVLLAIEAESWTPEPLLEARSAWHRAETRLGRQPVLRVRWPIHAGDDSTVAVAWNPAGTIIATGNVDGTLRLFDAATRRPIGDVMTRPTATPCGRWRGIRRAPSSPPATTMARCGYSTPRLTTEVGDAVITGNSFTLAVAWNPAGTIIATGNGDGTVRLFDATTLQPDR